MPAPSDWIIPAQRLTSVVQDKTGALWVGTASGIVRTDALTLSVTPQISADGMINMSISPSLTERTGQATSRFGDTVPILSVRETDTLVRVHENETIVIAGLMEERMRREERKVPFMGDLPGVGRLFRSEVTNRRKTDLVILLTPTVMTPARVPESTAQELNRLSEAKGDPKP